MDIIKTLICRNYSPRNIAPSQRGWDRITDKSSRSCVWASYVQLRSMTCIRYSCCAPWPRWRQQTTMTSSYEIGKSLVKDRPKIPSEINNKKSQTTWLRNSSPSARSPHAIICSFVCGVYVTNEKKKGAPVCCKNKPLNGRLPILFTFVIVTHDSWQRPRQYLENIWILNPPFYPSQYWPQQKAYSCLKRNSTRMRKSMHIYWPAIVSQKQHKTINQIMPWKSRKLLNSDRSFRLGIRQHSQP